MTWIGGIFSKVDTSQDELGRKLAVMIEAACLPNGPSTAAYPHCRRSILDDVHGQALVQISLPVEGTPRVQVYDDQPEKLALVYDGHLYGVRSVKSRLTRAQQGEKETVAEFLVHLLAELPANLEQKVKRTLTGLDGDYALAVTNTHQIVIARNSLGTKPLYIAENNDFSAFASNKKPLWKIGLDEVRPLRAGMHAVLDSDEVSAKRALPFHKKVIEIKSMDEAVDKYERALRSAIQKRLAAIGHVRKVGVLLSGGVDSCLIAKLICDAASALGMEVIAYTAGLPNSPDVKLGQEFARELGIKHKMKMLNIDRVRKYIPEVIEAIEDSDFVQVETGIGLYAAMDLANQDGISVIFSGQGPDELWGGYTWYPKVLGRDGRQELCRRMWDDLARVDLETLDRENKIAMTHGVELLFPYLDTGVANVAMSVPSELKVISEEDYLGKRPHRQLALKMGISEKYANREKLAIQHGTGIHGVLDKIARKNGFDPSLVRDIGYMSEEVTTEKMGSSARYGHRYIDKRLWQVPQHVQLFLHVLAYGKRLLNKSVRDRVERFAEEARLSSRVLV